MKQIKEGAMPLVIVTWTDAHGCNIDWTKLDHIKKASDLLVCKSVGFLAHRDKDCIILVPHITELRRVSEEGERSIEDQGCGDMTIPMQAVVKIRKLGTI